MIRVLFDHQIFSEQQYGGISRYFTNLYSEINKRKQFKVIVAILIVKNYYAKNIPQIFGHLFGRWLFKKDDKRYHWNRKYSKYLLKMGRYDIYHATYYDNYALKYLRSPMVITIHDMIHESNPEMFNDSVEIIQQKKVMMEHASAIIAISNYTKNEIIKFYPQFQHKLTVIYHGLPNEELDLKNEFFPTPENFILFVGERGNYKNFKILMQALIPFFKEKKEFKMIAAGGGAFSFNEIDYLKSYGLLDQCQQVSVTDAQLKILYQNATLFIYPSALEGFGLPLLEAFRNNCPTACSNLACLPEIGGNAVLYFNPNIQQEILDTTEKIVFNTNIRNRLIQSGLERLKDFSMDKCVENTLNIYEKHVKN